MSSVFGGRIHKPTIFKKIGTGRRQFTLIANRCGEIFYKKKKKLIRAMLDDQFGFHVTFKQYFQQIRFPIDCGPLVPKAHRSASNIRNHFRHCISSATRLAVLFKFFQTRRSASALPIRLNYSVTNRKGTDEPIY